MATKGLELLQVPPGVVLVKVDVMPVQNEVVPLIGAGAVPPTVKVVVTKVPRVYVIVVVPIEIDVTIPDDEPMVATEVLLLVQMPPVVVESLSVEVVPIHPFVLPVIGPIANVDRDSNRPITARAMCFVIC